MIAGLFCCLYYGYDKNQGWIAINPNQISEMEAIQTWTTVVLVIAVLLLIVGSIGLLIKKKWCVPVLVASLVLSLIKELYLILFTDFMALFGLGSTLALPMIIIAISMVLYLYAGKLNTAGQLS